MAFAGFNMLAVAIAAAAAFLFGGVWYGVLSRQWMAAADQTPETVSRTGFLVPMLVTVVGLGVMAFVLAGVIGHLGPGQVNIRNGVISGAFIWAGFIATTLAISHAYQGRSWRLTLIDGGHWLGVLLIQGAVIGFMGV